jgi:hypothetical protein
VEKGAEERGEGKGEERGEEEGFEGTKNQKTYQKNELCQHLHLHRPL